MLAPSEQQVSPTTVVDRHDLRVVELDPSDTSRLGAPILLSPWTDDHH
jgi:hypothetical protein